MSSQLPSDLVGGPPRRSLRRLLAAGVAVAVLLLPLVSVVAFLRHALRQPSYPLGEDGISWQVGRYAALGAELRRRGIGGVGYLSDLREGRPFRDTWFFDVVVARYALRPVVLRETAEEAFVVGNFTSGAAATAASAGAGLRILVGFGDGVYLLGRSR